MKTKYIENGLIIINLILVLYLVYVLSNRTIETFYSNQGNQGCEGLCNNSWSKPQLPTLAGANMELIDNHLYISSIQLEGKIDERFDNVWFLKFTLSQGEVNSGYHEKLFSIGDSGGTLQKVDDQYNIFSISSLFKTPDAWLIFKIKIDLKKTVPVTTDDFTMKLSILDEDMIAQGEPMIRYFPYKPCNQNAGDRCIEFTDCCNGMVCIMKDGSITKECSIDCNPGFYRDGSVCILCPSTGKTSGGDDITGCVACNAGTYREHMGDDQSECSPCPSGTYRTIEMDACSSNCIPPDYSPYQRPNPILRADCVDCEPGKAADIDGNVCAQSCSGAQVPNANKSDCVDCPSGEKPNADNSACILCDDDDYRWEECPTWYCYEQAAPDITGELRDDAAETCVDTKTKKCPNCVDQCSLIGLHYNGNTVQDSGGCCRPLGKTGGPESPSDCGGGGDSDKRQYPCCSGTCNLVTYRTTGYRNKNRHRGHRCV